MNANLITLGLGTQGTTGFLVLLGLSAGGIAPPVVSTPAAASTALQGTSGPQGGYLVKGQWGVASDPSAGTAWSHAPGEVFTGVYTDAELLELMALDEDLMFYALASEVH
jgi:hypothetical protein